ncbi:mandelate racemase/muconate lactonizing enzyme family protein [Labrys monachus]|uniref:L-alanine-DL-glutamate epimerase-like enolase superfamily enzyme n=1 Tax=Labrys monachus TaxID=217067 RepID=A0ABU0FAC3_9HYPH|nr:mandelate racemase/muconate lactonizing enzyme family protein [Labrys monachus]MDQ0391491.1 L-alanine-DL-glutamate epimerase-like enolase superfamily enzyme [Labrys monachus]
MKLESVRVFVVGNPPPGYGGRYFVFLKLRTACGIEGVGEAYAATFGPHVVARMIEDVFMRRFEGEDPTRIESLWRRVHGSGFTLRPDPSLMGVMSALEMACWDIAGKAANRPVYDLLGGKVRERLRSYTYIYPEEGESDAVYHDAERSAERASDYVRQGFTALKFDPAGAYSAFDPRQPDLESLALSERFIRLIREAVGTKADLLFGTHGQFTTSGAIRLARRLEPYDPLWFEEPVPPEMPEEMAKVAHATTIPIATGERLTTKYEFARVLATGAASILQMNLGRVGGLLEAKKIAGMAEAHYAQIAPHLYCGPIVGAANIQLAACIPNFLILESIERWGGFHAELLKTPILWEDGHVIPPTAPGLGVELDETVALAHPYPADGRLHLEMTEQPLG